MNTKCKTTHHNLKLGSDSRALTKSEASEIIRAAGHDVSNEHITLEARGFVQGKLTISEVKIEAGAETKVDMPTSGLNAAIFFFPNLLKRLSGKQ